MAHRALLAVAVLAGLDLEAADGVHRLGCEPQVPHDRDLGIDDRLDHRQSLAAALQLDGLSAGPDQRGRVSDRIVDGGVVAHPRQVTHHQGT